MSDDEDQKICTFIEIKEEPGVTGNVVIPTKSKQRYEVMFESFKNWQNLNKTNQLLSEDVLLTYFRELSIKKSPSTLWSSYSMLKAMIKLKLQIDISKYSNLIGFLKAQSKGYTPVKSKVFTNEEITNFIKEAPDEIYLATKVVLIFGLMGACKTDELVNITTDQIQTYDNMFLIRIPKTQSAVARTFTISDQYFDIVNKYKDLRPQNEKTLRFFLNYQKGKCTCQPIGKNKFAKMPQQIAEYLKLEDAKGYTGHSFRKTSTTLLANAGVDLVTIKRPGVWKSTTIAEGYIQDSLYYKRKTESLIKSRLNRSSSFDCSSNSSNLPDFETDSQSMITELCDSRLNQSSFVDCTSSSSNFTDFITDSESMITELRDGDNHHNINRADLLNKHFSFNNCNNLTININ